MNAAAHPSPRLRALAPLTTWGISPVELVTVAAAAGYDAVGIKIYSSMQGAMTFPMAPGSPMMREIRSRLADSGLVVWDVETFLIAPGSPVQSLLPLMETAAELGARHLLCGSTIADQQEGAAKFAELCDMAAPLGLTANLEFFAPWIGAPDLPSALATVTAADRANGKVLIDTLHAWRTGVSTQALRALPKGRLAYAQLCDAPQAAPADLEGRVREAMEGRLLPGEGSIPLVDMLRALPPGLPVAVEVPRQAGMTLEQAHAHAKAAIAATDRVLRLVDDVTHSPA